MTVEKNATIPMKMRVLVSVTTIAVCAALSLAPSAEAQILSTQRAGQGLPAGQVQAPSTPGGMVLVGSDIYIGDAAQGLRHFIPADPTNPDPVNTGILILDSNQLHSLGGNTDPTAVALGAGCNLFCSVGQIAYDGSTNVFTPAYDPQQGGKSSIIPGVWHDVTPMPPFAAGQEWWGTNNLLAPNAGLAGNLPTASAFGPDGQLYVGSLKNGDILRISHPTNIEPSSLTVDPSQTVQKIGGTPNGRPARALVFVGADLYIGSSDSLSVIHNATAPTCTGGCNAVPIADGASGLAHVGLATDGIDKIYTSVFGRGVIRYSISGNSTSVVSTSGLSPNSTAPVAYSFVAGHSNLLYLDRLGNLWIGDDSSGGLTINSGRLWYISAAELSTLP